MRTRERRRRRQLNQIPPPPEPQKEGNEWLGFAATVFMVLLLRKDIGDRKKRK